jgi:hypothetical protein
MYGTLSAYRRLHHSSACASLRIRGSWPDLDGPVINNENIIINNEYK